MSIYDLLMLAVMIGCIVFGLWKGLAWQLASVAAIFVSYFVSLNFRHVLAPYISVQEPWNGFAAMLILFLGSSLLVWMVYGYLKKSIERLRLRGFDAQAGGLLGAFKGVFVCMLITLFSVTIFGSTVRESVVNSRSGGYIAASINAFNSMVPQEIHAVLDQHVQSFNNNLNAHQPGYVQQSQRKLEEKLQTIRGKLQVPGSQDNQYGSQFGTQDNGFVTGGGGASTGGSAQSAGDGFVPPNVRTFGDEVFDAAKEAGRQFVDERLNR